MHESEMRLNIEMELCFRWVGHDIDRFFGVADQTETPQQRMEQLVPLRRHTLQSNLIDL